MTILGLILAVVLFALLYWLVTHLPIAPETKKIIVIVLIVVAIIVVLWLLLGLLGVNFLGTRVP